MNDFRTIRALVDRFPALRDVGGSVASARIPYVQQLTASDCGAACLAMVLAHYGRPVSLAELRTLTTGGRDATNAQRLIDAGRVYGLRGRAVSLDVDELKYLPRGTILHFNFNHFVVLDRLTRRGVKVVDPARGHWHVPMAEFRRSFTGAAIVSEPSDTFERRGRKQSGVRRYLSYILTEKGFLPHIIVASLAMQVCGLAMPLLNRVLIDDAIPAADYQLLLVISLSAAFVILCQAGITAVRSLLMLYLRTRLDSRLTLGFLDHMLSLPFDFFQRRSTGDLLVRLGSNATVRDILTSTILSGILDGALALSYLVVLLAISPVIARITIVLAVIQLLMFMIRRQKRKQFLAQAMDAQSKSSGYLVEMFAAIETLKSMGIERRAVDRWSALFARELNVSLARGRIDAVLDTISTVVRGGSSLVLFSITAAQVMAGAITLGDMMALTAIATGFLAPMTSVLSNSTRLQLLGVYLDRLNDVFDAAPETTATGVVERLKGDLSLENVSFRYGPTSALVVRDVSLSIRAGEFVALVGASGSGKSTLVRLLAGLYAPTAGKVSYDGRDVAGLDLEALRRQLGVVTQQNQLFAGTIRSNIALANPDMPLTDVFAAAAQACIHDDIVDMPMGYDTPLIDRGGSLSGGQQQRLCLARALAGRPAIVLLDEATSQLDAATERAIQEKIAELSCTRIVVAHRLSTVVNADRILVMDAGSIIEQGRHDELLAANGCYARLVAAQLTKIQDTRQ